MIYLSAASALFVGVFLLARVPESCQDAVIAWAMVALVLIYR